MKTLKQLQADPRVSEAYQDDDGYWITLTEGYVDVIFDPWQPCFTIHEYTLKNAIARLSDVRLVV